jgi:hypothetical protein
MTNLEQREEKNMKNQQQVQFMYLLDGMMRSQALYTAAKLDIADRLGDSRKSISQLAQETRSIPLSFASCTCQYRFIY